LLYLYLYFLIIFFGPLVSRLAFLSYENIWKRVLRGCESLLDLGCGINSPVQFCPVSSSTGVDISRETVDECLRLNVFSEAFQKDVRELKLSDRRYDAVIALGLLEYLEKSEALSLLKKMESCSNKKTVVVVANGRVLGEENPLSLYTEQKSLWNHRDFSIRGYKVRGINGWKGLRNNQGLIKKRPFMVWQIVSMATQLFVYFFPGQAYRIIAVKKY